MIPQQFIRIGGKALFLQTYRHASLPAISYIQTDGSFKPGEARIAGILQTPAQSIQYMFPIKAKSSTETEWASVAFGLHVAIQYNCDAVALENDNLSVICSLLFPDSRLRNEYARLYRDRILSLSNKTEWTGIRWIPRDQNTADALFR